RPRRPDDSGAEDGADGEDEAGEPPPGAPPCKGRGRSDGGILRTSPALRQLVQAPFSTRRRLRLRARASRRWSATLRRFARIPAARWSRAARTQRSPGARRTTRAPRVRLA